MQEPIKEVPKTRVIMCILWNTARVERKATVTEIKIEPTENKSGFGERNTTISIRITMSIEIVAIVEISREAEVELLWLW